MMKLKGCPRCRGDLYIEETFGERELVCLQCGRRVALVEWAPVRALMAPLKRVA